MTAENFPTRGHSTNIKKPHVLMPALGRMELVRSASGFIPAQSSPDIADKTLRDKKINFRMRLCVFNPGASFAHHSSLCNVDFHHDVCRATRSRLDIWNTRVACSARHYIHPLARSCMWMWVHDKQWTERMGKSLAIYISRFFPWEGMPTWHR